MTNDAKLAQLQALLSSASCTLLDSERAALQWAVAEITRLNSRNATLEYQTNKLCQLCDDMRETLQETRGSTVNALAQFEATIAADLREAGEGRP